MSQQQIQDQNPERITVITPEFGSAAFEFHRANMAERGYQIDGPIVPRRFMSVGGGAAAEDLFDGDEMYAVSFVRVAN